MEFSDWPKRVDPGHDSDLGADLSVQVDDWAEVQQRDEKSCEGMRMEVRMGIGKVEVSFTRSVTFGSFYILLDR